MGAAVCPESVLYYSRSELTKHASAGGLDGGRWCIAHIRVAGGMTLHGAGGARTSLELPVWRQIGAGT